MLNPDVNEEAIQYQIIPDIYKFRELEWAFGTDFYINLRLNRKNINIIQQENPTIFYTE